MILSNFYVLVDTETKQVIDKIQKLPENWNNIAGLPGLSNEQLCDLNWAGHHNLGWINIHSKKIKEYSSSLENLELNKNTFKLLVSEIRKNEESEPIEYHSAKIKPDQKTQVSLLLLKNQDSVNFKCINGYHTFNRQQILEISDIIHNKIQYLFNKEKEIFDQIDKCITISDFLNVNYDF